MKLARGVAAQLGSCSIAKEANDTDDDSDADENADEVSGI